MGLQEKGGQGSTDRGCSGSLVYTNGSTKNVAPTAMLNVPRTCNRHAGVQRSYTARRPHDIGAQDMFRIMCKYEENARYALKKR